MQIRLGSMDLAQYLEKIKTETTKMKNVIFTCFTQNLGYVQWVAIVDG